eukprot:COSAG01_NODE_12372_length_1749_cov_2.509685_1_plen_73_part_10
MGDPSNGLKNALHIAAEGGKISLLEYLLSSRGADPLATDRNGRTPADLATNDEIGALLRGAAARSSGGVAPRR